MCSPYIHTVTFKVIMFPLKGTGIMDGADRTVYIAYRYLPGYNQECRSMNGNPAIYDNRLTNRKNNVYLLEFGNSSYAVSTERGDQFVEEVLSKCTDKHRGLFPSELPGCDKEYVAVVEISEGSLYSYYDMDADVLLQMLETLKAESGEPLTRRELINHCYPNPKLPEGDFDVKSITHQIFIYEKSSPSVIQTFHPDKRTSHFWIFNDEAHLELREDNTKNTYDVPSELIPWIKEKVRELCADPAEAYVEDGKPESYIYFGKDGDERIFTKPDNTYALLKDIASKSILKETKEIKDNGNPYGGATSINAFFGMNSLNGMMGTAMLQNSSPAPAHIPSDGEKCKYCGAPKNAGRFCSECGGEYK